MSSVHNYDFIVVGAGTAGCVIASRLAETGRTRVLLLEAGSAAPLAAMAVPAAWTTLLASTASWGEVTVAQRATGTTPALARGRALGGSSAINAMVFARGHRSSYDAWPRAGAIGWGFDDLMPYFRRCERAAGRDPALRGTSGPLRVGPANPPNPVLAACLEAAIAAGHRRAGDISGGLEDGFGLVDLNIVAGKRQSAADAYILPIAADPNLELVTDAVVHRLRIVHGRCVGVDYMVRGTQISASCTREVILSAGAIGSPKLLMLSGVGPAAHLRELGIDVALDLPGVGANFHDHPVANLIYCAARPVPPAQHNHGEILGLVRSDPSLAAPDLQIIFIDTPRRMPGVVAPDHGYSIGVSVMTPASRGTVRLASARPDAAPLLDPNFLGDDRDLAALVAGLELGRAIGRAAPLDAWRAAELAPGAQLADAAGLRGYVRRTVGSYFHPVGTCAIGDGELGVVDSALRVRGLAGLRVADGSVMPSIPSANTSATVYAIGERAAELIAET